MINPLDAAPPFLQTVLDTPDEAVPALRPVPVLEGVPVINLPGARLPQTEVALSTWNSPARCLKPVETFRLLAARRGDVIASAATWYREVRRRGLRRPRKRIHPRRPKIGVRSSAPNELWHIDASRVRLLDGTVVWIQGIIDNCFRKILAWTIGGSCIDETVERLVGRFVEDRNTFIPRTALSERRPDEVFVRVAADLPQTLVPARAAVQRDRVKVNHSLVHCGGCDGPSPSNPRKDGIDS